MRARTHACVCVCVNACVCSRRQDSGGAANVGALCRLVNARRDVTGHARLTKWTSFAKSAPPPPKYIFPRPFRAAFSCLRIFVFFFLNSPLYQFHSTCSKLLLCSEIICIIIIIINTSIKMSQSQFVFIILFYIYLTTKEAYFIYVYFFLKRIQKSVGIIEITIPNVSIYNITFIIRGSHCCHPVSNIIL